MKIASPFTREFWIDDTDVRKAVGPLPPRSAAQQARLSFIAVESDREIVMRDKIQRMETLLLRCQPHVQEAFQGRGDQTLLADMQEEFRRG